MVQLNKNTSDIIDCLGKTTQNNFNYIPCLIHKRRYLCNKDMTKGRLQIHLQDAEKNIYFITKSYHLNILVSILTHQLQGKL